MNRLRIRIGVAATVGLMTCVVGCAPKTIYDWGRYEDALYVGLVHPGKEDVTTQSTRLAADIQRTELSHRRVPPGVRAQLGYLYFMQGYFNEARAEFEGERAAFPESAVFIDGIISRMDHKIPVAMVVPTPTANPSPNPAVEHDGSNATLSNSPKSAVTVEPADAAGFEQPDKARATTGSNADLRPAPAQPDDSQLRPEPLKPSAGNAAESHEAPESVDPFALMPPSFEERE